MGSTRHFESKLLTQVLQTYVSALRRLLWLLGLRCGLGWLLRRDLRRHVLSLGGVGHGWHLGYLSALGIRDQNSKTIQSKANDAIQLHPRLFISSHRRYQVRLRLRPVTLRLQHQRSGRGAQRVFLLFSIQRLPAQFDRGSSGFHAGAVLLHGELRVAHFDAYLVLELLQAHLGLTVFQLGTHLVGLRRAVAQRDGQAQSDTFIWSAGVEKLPDSSSNARAGRNIGGLCAEGLHSSRANPRVRIKRAA